MPELPRASEFTRSKMTAHRKAPVPSVSAYRPTVPAQLDAVLQRMLAKRPTQRYQRPAEVVAALEPFTHGCDLVELVTKADVPHSDTNPRADDDPAPGNRPRRPGVKASSRVARRVLVPSCPVATSAGGPDATSQGVEELHRALALVVPWPIARIRRIA